MSARSAALVLGGAGFIGTNLADRLMQDGRDVIVFDDLSRRGAQANLSWLLDRHPDRLTVWIGDIRDPKALAEVVQRATEVYHFAAQVAVTSSLDDPFLDFEINARGTLNVLEALRRLDDPPPLLFTSTNKVYGALDDIELTAVDGRYAPADPETRERGVDERRPLDFHSPYGCSKGTADQYVRDYARCFGLRTVVFRMSCIYGPHQHGNEDQGWVAHLMMRARAGATVTIFGDGLQVRDVLYVDDLVSALQLAMRNSGALAGRVFNIGGGPANTLSVLELITVLRDGARSPVRIQHDQARVGDQRYYVSDTRAFTHATGWQPGTTVTEGLARLDAWIAEANTLTASQPAAVAVAR
jgi:CDP-paratose 2-epimerase